MGAATGDVERDPIPVKEGSPLTRISVHQAQAGMQVAHPIRDLAGRTLLEKGAVLTVDLIARLKKFGVSSLDVEGTVAAGNLTIGIVRDMLEALSEEYPTCTFFGCALELRAHGMPALEFLVAFLERPDPRLLEAALGLLGEVAHLFTDTVLWDFLPALDVEVSAWSDEDGLPDVAGDDLPGLDVHAEAVRERVYALAVPSLARALGHPDDRVRMAAARGLERVEPSSETLRAERRAALERGLRDPHPEVALACALALENNEPPATDVERRAVSAAYAHVLVASRSPRRYRAVLGLGRLDQPGARDALLEVLADPTISIRRSALYALGDLREQRAVPLLMDMVADADDGVRAWACRALGRIGAGTAGSVLVAALHDVQEHVVRQAADALLALGVKAEPTLLGALGDPDWFVRYDICHILGAVGTLRALPSLKIRAGTDDHRFVREAAAAAAAAILERLTPT